MKQELALARKIFIYVLALVASPMLCLAADHVVISQVYYDPLTTESGGEAVELYNPSGSTVDIGGWTLMTESSLTDATVPAGTLMPPHTYYLIADSGWSSEKDNPSWPDADLEEAISMTNTDAGVAIVDSSANIIDAVGWGDPLNIGTGLYESTPALEVLEGQSLARSDLSVDTDDNSVDFQESAPNLHNSDFIEDQSGQGISVSVNIFDNTPSVDSVTVLGDEDALPGVQISPLPGDIKTVEVRSNITDPDGVYLQATLFVDGISFEMQKLADINSTTAEFAAEFNMSFSSTPGTYSVNVSIEDQSAAVDFEYLSMAAIDIDTTDLEFQGAVGQTSVILGDLDTATQEPTIRNIGNSELDIAVYGTDLTDGEKSITVDNLLYSFDNDFGSTLAGTVSYVASAHSLGLLPGLESAVSLALQLSVPSDAQEGNYTGSVYIAAVGV